MISIVGSVGKRGMNFRNDVILVQELLNRSTATPKTLLAIDGFAGYKTIEMIYLFQKRVVGFKSPDSLIDPNGRTWKQLRRYHYLIKGQ
jgi:peptidoglycan hydrolase-like protein with peptidoglycan-binding domain